MVWFTSSTVRSSVCLRLAMAALLTRQSRPPNASHASSATASAALEVAQVGAPHARLGRVRQALLERPPRGGRPAGRRCRRVAPRSASCGAESGADARRRAGDENRSSLRSSRGSLLGVRRRALRSAASRSSVVTPVVASAWCTSGASKTDAIRAPQIVVVRCACTGERGRDAIEGVGRRHVHVARHHRRHDRAVAVDRDAGAAQLAALVVAEPDRVVRLPRARPGSARRTLAARSRRSRSGC